MNIAGIISSLENLAPLSYQEGYDNSGLIAGSASWECTGILISLDCTEDIIQEAVDRHCNLIVSHHPIIFRGLKKITGADYVERTIISAIKNNIAVYAIHTNLDNVLAGVNGRIASLLGLVNTRPLQPMKNTLKKIYTFVPLLHADKVRDEIFATGAGKIGNYSETSFNGPGQGTFKAGTGANPFVGKEGERHHENEVKIEIIFPAILQKTVIAALLRAHPYEEPAYDILTLDNLSSQTGSGLYGELITPMEEKSFLAQVKKVLKTAVLRHSALLNRPVKKIAVCGGAGSFLISSALSLEVDVFITADLKYHEFFEADKKLILADPGHFETEQFTIDLLHDYLQDKFRNFAVLKTGINTNPVNYY